jgi:hypothetical protein
LAADDIASVVAADFVKFLEQERSQLRQQAVAILAPLTKLTPDFPLDLTTPHGTFQLHLLTWLLTSVLRTPIVLRQDGETLPLDDQSTYLAYDGVDCRIGVDGDVAGATHIGVDTAGFSMQVQEHGQPVYCPVGHGGHSVGDFLSAYWCAHPQRSANQFSLQQVDDGPPRLLPDGSVKKTVAALLERLQQFAALDYGVLHHSVTRVFGAAHLALEEQADFTDSGEETDQVDIV